MSIAHDESVASLIIDVARSATRSRLTRYRTRICLADCEAIESDVVLELWQALQKPTRPRTGREIQAFAGRIASCRIKDFIRTQAGDAKGKQAPALLPHDSAPMVAAVAPDGDDCEPSLLAQSVAMIDNPRLRSAAYALMEGGEFTDIAAELGIDRRSLTRLREKLRDTLSYFDPSQLCEEDAQRIARRNARIDNRRTVAQLIQELESEITRAWLALDSRYQDDRLIGDYWEQIAGACNCSDPSPSWIEPLPIDTREDSEALARRQRINRRIGIGDVRSSIDDRPTGRPAHPRPISGRLLRDYLKWLEAQELQRITTTARLPD